MQLWRVVTDLGSWVALVSNSIAVAAEVRGPGHCCDFYHYYQRAGYLPILTYFVQLQLTTPGSFSDSVQPLSGSDVPSLTKI